MNLSPDMGIDLETKVFTENKKKENYDEDNISKKINYSAKF